MSTYAPGTVAIIGWSMKSGQERAMTDGCCWFTESGIQVKTPTTVRPLVVLDIPNRATAEDIARVLRADGYGQHADQIEAQTKPPRIDEPGPTGSLIKDSGRLWAKADDGLWVCLSDGQSGNRTSWDFFINPEQVTR